MNNNRSVILVVLILCIIGGLWYVNSGSTIITSTTTSDGKTTTTASKSSVYTPAASVYAATAAPKVATAATPVSAPAAPAAPVGCPAGSSPTGQGLDVGGGCKCKDWLHYWNGSSCMVCPPNSSVGSTGPVVPNDGAGRDACRCFGGVGGGYWKDGINRCDLCPGRSAYVRPEDEGLILGSTWVPGGQDWHITLGQTPPDTCACVNNESWPCV